MDQSLDKNNYFLSQKFKVCFVGEKNPFIFWSKLKFKILTNSEPKKYLEHSGLFKEVEYNSRSQVQLFSG